jgi:transposase
MMLSLPEGVRYFLYQGPADMRCTFNGLSGLVTNELKENPLSGDIFIFFSRRRNQLKLLQWQRDGFALYHKRLEGGTFELPPPTGEKGSLTISGESLLLILRGIQLSSVRHRTRFRM